MNAARPTGAPTPMQVFRPPAREGPLEATPSHRRIHQSRGLHRRRASDRGLQVVREHGDLFDKLLYQHSPLGLGCLARRRSGPTGLHSASTACRSRAPSSTDHLAADHEKAHEPHRAVPVAPAGAGNEGEPTAELVEVGGRRGTPWSQGRRETVTKKVCAIYHYDDARRAGAALEESARQRQEEHPSVAGGCRRQFVEAGECQLSGLIDELMACHHDCFPCHPSGCPRIAF